MASARRKRAPASGSLDALKTLGLEQSNVSEAVRAAGVAAGGIAAIIIAVGVCRLALDGNA